MSAWRFILRSLLHHWRINAAVAMGVMAATAVLTGALLVGDSVRGSLKTLALDRLGKIDEVLVTDRFFRAELAEELARDPRFKQHFNAATPAILFPQGTVEHRGDERTMRAGGVTVVGCDEAFWKLGQAVGRPSQLPGDGEIVLNAPLAADLGVKVGDEVVLRLPKVFQVPADSALGKKADRVRSLAGLKVVAIVPSESLGWFSLRPSQSVPRNAYVSLTSLQEALEQDGRVNAVLVPSDRNTDPYDDVASRTLAEILRPPFEDYGFRITPVRRTFQAPGSDDEQVIYDYFSFTSDTMMFEPAAEMAALQSLTADLAQPVFTYLANSISKVADDDPASANLPASPSSPITAIDSIPQLGPLLENGKPIELADDEIVLSSWAAADLAARPGDKIRVSFFEPETTHGETVERSEDFTLKAIVPLTEPAEPFRRNRPPRFDQPPTLANDPDLTPEVPGITDQASIADWDAPFPFDYKRIRPQDDDYWENHRTTPKAFISLAAGQRLWRSRFGQVTSFRIPARDGLTEDRIKENFLDQLARDKAKLGFEFIPVKRQGLQASSGTTPFDMLFLALSFFIITAALMLVSLLFRLGIEQRAREIGTLLAVGLRQRLTGRLLVTEGALVAAIGGLAGVIVGVGYAWLMIIGLHTIWVGAVTTAFLELHIGPLSLVIGYSSGVIVSVLTIAWSIRATRRISMRRLLSGQASQAVELVGNPRRESSTLGSREVARPMKTYRVLKSEKVSPAVIHERFAGKARGELLRAIHNPDHSDTAIQTLKAILIAQGMTAEQIESFRYSSDELDVLPLAKRPSIEEALRRPKRWRVVYRSIQILTFVCFVSFIVFPGSALTTALLAAALLLFFPIKLAAWCWPARILLLRPFDTKDVSKWLKRFIRRNVTFSGHVFTLADQHLNESLFVYLTSFVPLGPEGLIELLLYPWSKRSRRRIYIKNASDFLALKSRLESRWLLNTFWTNSWWDKIRKIRAVDRWWQRCIDLLAASCDVILVDLSLVKAGTRWELSKIRNQNLDAKSIFIVQKEQIELGRTILADYWPAEALPEVYAYDEKGRLENSDAFGHRFANVLARARPPFTGTPRVYVWAIVSLFTWPIPWIGLPISLLSWLNISRSEGRLRGKRLVQATAFLSVLAWAGMLAIVARRSGGETQAGAFVGAGASVLAALLVAIWIRFRSIDGRAATVTNRFVLAKLAARNAGRNPSRSTMTIALIATASFLIVAMSSFRLAPTEEGTGGFDLLAESSQPVFADLNTADGRKDLLADKAAILDGGSVLSLRVKPGDNASCNNLYKAAQPRVLGVTPTMIEHFDRAGVHGFSWAGSAAKTDEQRANPWQLLGASTVTTGDAVPVVLDKNTAMYSLQLYKGIGEEFTFTYDNVNEVRFRVVGLLSNSILQGSLLVGEADFVKRFPQVSGYNYFLITSPPGKSDQVTEVLEDKLSDQGFDAASSYKLLEQLLAVQNTYLSTFQSLGALGLLLGTFGLAAVQLRSVLERRGELALLRAAGFRRRRLSQMVLLENTFLLLGGLSIGIFAALLSVLPHMLLGGATIPLLDLTVMLTLVLTAGLLSGLLAARATLRAPLLSALRGE